MQRVRNIQRGLTGVPLCRLVHAERQRVDRSHTKPSVEVGEAVGPRGRPIVLPLSSTHSAQPIAWGYWVLVHAPVFDNLGFAVHFLQENTLQFLFPDAWDMRYRPLVTHTFYVLPVLVPVMIHFVRRRIDGLTFMTSSFPPLHRPTIVLSNRFPTRQLRQVPSRRACCCTLPSIFIRLHDLGFLSSSTSSVDHDTLYSSNHTSQITSIYYCDDSSSSE